MDSAIGGRSVHQLLLCWSCTILAWKRGGWIWGQALTLTINLYNPIHSHRHELWVVTERMKSQVAEITLLCGVPDVLERQGQGLGSGMNWVELLYRILYVDMSQLRWSVQVYRTPPFSCIGHIWAEEDPCAAWKNVVEGLNIPANLGTICVSLGVAGGWLCFLVKNHLNKAQKWPLNWLNDRWVFISWISNMLWTELFFPCSHWH